MTDKAFRRVRKPKLSEQSGATMIEYALITALLAVALIAAVTALRQNVSRSFSSTGSALEKS